MPDRPYTDADGVRDDLLRAIDFNFCVGALGYESPEALLDAYDASRAAAVPSVPADAEQGDLRAALARVRGLADAIDAEMRTEPDTQRAAMQHEAAIRIRAALDGHPLAGREQQAAVQPPADRDLRDRTVADALHHTN
ncbi:hypothetical protein [Streptomyces sp. CC224B]|uniref:hypothetical protein n=1 Tax=Streptomyces sp. CC224B TaxID=3044571 RepID=UPI0024A86425|nr:hypothetical protein [Streptomyces sp. CC224B]